MTLKRDNRFVDLVLTEASPSYFKKARRQYRVCTISENRGQNFINLRIPESAQEKIISAYRSGKKVRIFA